MLSPLLFSKQNRSNDEAAAWEARRTKLYGGYDGSPWLSALVTFSGFVAAFIGSVTALLVIANLRHGTVWVPYAVILAALVAAHLSLRTVRYQRRRHAKQSAVGDASRSRNERRPQPGHERQD